ARDLARHLDSVLEILERCADRLHHEEGPLEFFFCIGADTVAVDVHEPCVLDSENVSATSASMNRAWQIRPLSALGALKPGTKLLIVHPSFNQLLVAFGAVKTSLDQKVVYAVYSPAGCVFKESLSLYVDRIAIGADIIVADICGQATRTNQDFFMEFAFEYS